MLNLIWLTPEQLLAILLMALPCVIWLIIEDLKTDDC